MSDVALEFVRMNTVHERVVQGLHQKLTGSVVLCSSECSDKSIHHCSS